VVALANVCACPFRNFPELIDFFSATPPPDSDGTFDRMPHKRNPTNGSGFLKPARAMPPRVDTSAASKKLQIRSSSCANNLQIVHILVRAR
jgi:hypothetical protein